LMIATAVAIQPGSSSTITLELSNLGGIAVKLRAGAAIGQLFFHKIDESEQSYKPHYGCSTQPQLEQYRKSLVENFLFDHLCRLSNGQDKALAKDR
jgi:deoxycytidine triphosphate deaminase